MGMMIISTLPPYNPHHKPFPHNWIRFLKDKTLKSKRVIIQFVCIIGFVGWLVGGKVKISFATFQSYIFNPAKE
jgi:hypothetical protein